MSKQTVAEPKPWQPDDFGLYLGTTDAREASLEHLQALARMRVALDRPVPTETYVAVRRVLVNA
jgi:hypothetical protein